MRNRLILSLVAAASFLAASSAHAGALTSATWTTNLQGIGLTVTNTGATCTDTLDTTVNADNTQPVVPIACPTAGLQPTGTATGAGYNVSLTMPLFSLDQFTTGGAININTKATIQGAQAINGTNGGAVTVDMGVPGMVTVMNAIHNKASLLSPGATTLVQVPLNVGVAAVETDFFYVLGNLHYITVDFYGWTTGTKVFAGLTTKGAALPNVTAKGSFNLDANGTGTVTLVSPSKISIDGPLAGRRTASFTSLKLSFGEGGPVPEPSTLLLLGAGVAGLVLVGSRKPS